MSDYVSHRRCNALLRRDPDPSLSPLRQTTKRLPKRHWVGGRLTVTGTELSFEGVQTYGSDSGTDVREDRDFRAPLARLSGIRVRRGPMIARFIEIEIDDGSLLHLRPTQLGETVELLRRATKNMGPTPA